MLFNTVMNHIKEVADRLRGLRDALDLSREEMAEQCGIEPTLLALYESGSSDIPVSFLHRLAAIYGIELTALLFGLEPKMDTYYVTRSGNGVKVERSKAYSYQDLAAGFTHRTMAPFLVKIAPGATDAHVNLNTHEGQEFNYILNGEVQITVGNKTIHLSHGDSIMFDAQIAHGLTAVGDKEATIIAIIS